MGAPTVSVVIPSYDRRAAVERLLESVAASAYPSLDVVVVDDCSEEDYAGLAADRPGVRVVRNPAERYLAESRNVGASRATGEYLFFVDDDNVLDDDAIPALVEHMERHPDAGVAGPVMCYLDAPETVWCAGVERNDWTSLTTFVGRGQSRAAVGDRPFASEDFPNAFMVRRAAFEAVGGFDSEHFPIHYDEADFCRRVRAAGFDVTTVPGATVWHDIAPPGEDMPRSFHLQSGLRAFYVARNRLVFHARYNSWTQLASVLFLALPAISLYYLLGIVRSNAENRIDVAASYVRGTVEGLSYCVARWVASPRRWLG